MAHKILQTIWEYKLWAFLLGFAALVPKLITAWHHIRHKWWDAPVFDFLDPRVPRDSIYGGKEYHPTSIQEISTKLGRSDKSILASLQRLKKGKMGDQVVEDSYGWYTKANAREN